MESTVEIFSQLGQRLSSVGNHPTWQQVVGRAMATNDWFSERDIHRAITAIANDMLQGETLARWAAEYDTNPSTKQIGIIMAGNIPAVGFFDLLCVAISGCRAVVKPSSKDSVLIEYIVQQLLAIAPSLPISIGPVDGCDALIATGSDNTNRYFSANYGHIPSLLRANRTSIAILDDNRTNLTALGEDIFSFNTMGCRSISRIFVPQGYNINTLVTALAPWRNMVSNKMMGSYRQQRALASLKNENIVDGGFFILTNHEGSSTALSRITYSYYNTQEELDEMVSQLELSIQCIASDFFHHPRAVPIGQAQHPTLWDYPDGVDTMRWLERVKKNNI